MKAVFLPGNQQVEVREVDPRKPGTGEVLIAVKASCICRSDMSLYYGNAVLPGTTPGTYITGHEPAGVIEEIGPGVATFKAGDRVAVHLGIGCGTCSACRRGIYHLCPTWHCIGFTADGGNAEYLVVPERNCLRIADSMSFVAAAISTDAFGTLYSACKKLEVSGASNVGIWGMGPMGSAGILAAKALGARVVAMDPIEERRRFADRARRRSDSRPDLAAGARGGHGVQPQGGSERRHRLLGQPDRARTWRSMRPDPWPRSRSSANCGRRPSGPASS